MNQSVNPAQARGPARWALLLAFALVYLSWGTTYLAIRKGVEVFPPCLFGGSRVTLAGLLLWAYLAVRGQPLRIGRDGFCWTGLVGVLMFVGGNGLLTVAEQSVASGVASVLAATSPFWMAVCELLWPRGERLRLGGWFGLVVGLGGVVFLLAPKLHDPAAFWQDAGPLLVLGSALSWAVGSFVMRHRRLDVNHLTAAAYQMVLGGGSTVLLGLFLGEGRQLAWESFTPQAVYAFFHLLVVGSLIGFVAYNWLLGHVSATLAGTCAYVNPVVAILAGWLLNDERLTVWILGGMAVILAGVALVRGGSAPRHQPSGAAEAAAVLTNGKVGLDHKVRHLSE